MEGKIIVRGRFISKRVKKQWQFWFCRLTSFDSGIATSSSLSKYTDQSKGAYFSEELLQKKKSDRLHADADNEREKKIVEAYLVGGRWGTEAKAEAEAGWVCCCKCSSVMISSGSEAMCEEESMALSLSLSRSRNSKLQTLAATFTSSSVKHFLFLFYFMPQDLYMLDIATTFLGIYCLLKPCKINVGDK